ncbi:hypothetical protein [Nitrosopumilus sp.]|uniref:hypothetical protein n=1 Tax=Nitrosopumilus sp. TaxID=2024843 RepID=UPI003B58EE85
MDKLMMLNKTHVGLFSILVIFVSVTAMSENAFADVIAPNHQMDMSFTVNEIVCKENLVKVIRTSNGNAVCVKPDAVDPLVDRGIIENPNPEMIALLLKETPKPVGTITHLATTKAPTNPGDAVGFSKITINNYVFKICSIDEKIKRPEVIITSDSETKSVKLARDISAEACNTTAVKVRAIDPNTINARLLNQGGVTEIITEFENKIEELKLDLSEQREKISAINNEAPSNDRAKKVSAIHKQITDLRNELKDTRADLQKYLLLLNVTPANGISQISAGKSITGVDVETVLSDIILVHEALIQPEQTPEGIMAFNVVFEVCTKDDVLRIPVVELSSDAESKTVRMAEKIVANSCQVTTSKINAINPNSISITLAGQTSTSSTIMELEVKIRDLQDLMQLEQQRLNSILTSSTLDKNEQQTAINESSEKVMDLQKQINQAKIDLHKILLEVYQ